MYTINNGKFSIDQIDVTLYFISFPFKYSLIVSSNNVYCNKNGCGKFTPAEYDSFRQQLNKNSYTNNAYDF